MPGWEDEPLGAFGSGATVPTGEWFPVNTETGQWGTTTPTLASDAGVNWAGIPDLIPTRTMAPSPMMGVPGGAPDQAPVSIGQVAGTMAPPMTTPRSMQRVQRLDEMGALTRQPGMWETIARGVGNLSPQGRAILQSSDQQQQQQLQNRLTMRRQALAEQQDERAQVRERFNSFAKLGEIKNKALRNLYADRLVKEMQDNGETFPADFVETFKKSSLKEGEQLTKFITPLLTDLGMDPAEVGELIASGNFDQIKPMLELAQKVKKDKTEQARLAALDKIGAGDTLGDVSGTTAPATPGAPMTTPAPTTRQPAAAPSPEYTSAIDEAHARYPQVRKELIPAIIAGESNFDAKAVSPKGAQGPMQLMPAAQKEMGVTDPFDVKQNVRGGTGYYAKMLERYKGNEALALAAYNWGPGHVDNVQGDLSKMPESVQSYVKTTLQRASGGGGVPATTATGQVPATGGTPQEQAQLTAYNTRIAALETNIERASRIGGEEGRARATAWERQRDNLAKERDRLETRLIKQQEALEEPGKIERRKQIEEPYELRKAEAAKALTPIDRMTQQSLATNKSVYRSIGKIEDYLREGTDLPADFVNLVAQDTPGISAWLQSDPKNITGLAKQWETKFKAVAENDPRANRFLAALGNMRDLVIRERSGGSVTGNELDRAMGAFMGSLPNINQAFSLFAQNLANVKETVIDELVTAGAASRPLSGGKAMHATLPKEIRDRIDYAERGEDYPKAQMPAASTATATKPPPGAKLGGPIKIVQP